MNKRKPYRHKKTPEELNSLSGLYPPGKRGLIMTSPENLTIGNRLRRERYLRKLTIEQMSAYLGISPSYLGAMERGDRPISRHMMNVLHEKLDISYDFMLEGLSITGSTISKYVKENGNYSIHHSLDVLLNVCDEEELQSCYQLVHTYLSHKRDMRPRDDLKS